VNDNNAWTVRARTTLSATKIVLQQPVEGEVRRTQRFSGAADTAPIMRSAVEQDDRFELWQVLLTDAAVDPLSQQVGMTTVPGVLLNHVYEDLAQLQGVPV
jgi:hypothetical protein